MSRELNSSAPRFRIWRAGAQRCIEAVSFRRLGLRARIVVASALLAIVIGTAGVVVTLAQTSQRLRVAASTAPDLTELPQRPLGPPEASLPRYGQEPGAGVDRGPLFPTAQSRPQLGTPAGRQAEGRVVERILDASRRRGLLTVAGLASLSVLAAWALSGRLVGPIRSMTDTARAVSAPGSGKRINLVGPRDEVHELADTIDQMLDRLDRAFESQRRFVADASHELRTPIAVLRAEVDVSLDDEKASVSALRSAMFRIGKELDRTTSLVESLLHLSRAETLISTEPHDLATAAEEAIANAKRLKLGPRIVKASLDPAPVIGDPILIDRLVGNLVENAFRYSPAQGLVRVFTTSKNGRSKLCVENDGPLINETEAGELHARFRRGAQFRSRGDGHGLGLAIVHAIVATHEAEMTIRPRLSGGLSVTVDFASPPV